MYNTTIQTIHNVSRPTSLPSANRIDGGHENDNEHRSPSPASSPILQNSSIITHNILTHLFHTPSDIDDEALSQNSDRSVTEGDSASEAGKNEFLEGNLGNANVEAIAAAA